jgi:hypothetical protein
MKLSGLYEEQWRVLRVGPMIVLFIATIDSTFWALEYGSFTRTASTSEAEEVKFCTTSNKTSIQTHHSPTFLPHPLITEDRCIQKSHYEVKTSLARRSFSDQLSGPRLLHTKFVACINDA